MVYRYVRSISPSNSLLPWPSTGNPVSILSMIADGMAVWSWYGVQVRARGAGWKRFQLVNHSLTTNAPDWQHPVSPSFLRAIQRVC
jgi:hypothetical protein